jgi:hypothetical protein
LAERGIPVFPCHTMGAEVKKPLTSHGFKVASTNSGTIQQWWRTWPRAIVGFPTGAASRVYVVDPDAPTDGREDGLAAFAQLELRHGAVETFTVRSVSGGRHYYFVWEPGYTNSSGRLPRGIDARGDGGYVIAPGSRLPDGGSWTVEKDSDLGRLPDWLKAMLQPKWETEFREACDPGETPAGLRELEVLCRLLSAAPNGKQNAELYRVAAEAGSLVGAGDLFLEKARERLLAAGGQMTNFKPHQPWTERELKRHINNGLRDGQRQPCCAVPTAAESFAEQEEAARRLFSQMGMEWEPPLAEPRPPVEARPAAAPLLASASTPEREASAKPTSSPEKPAPRDRNWPLRLSEDEEWIPPRPWVLGTTFCRGFLSALIGAGAVGKTGIRIAQALAVATGRELTGEKVWAKCPVLFVCMEDDEAELRRRFRAATKFFGIERSELHDMLIWSVKGERLATLTQQGTMRETNLYGDLAKYIKENGVGLVILDPFVKVHEVNENDNVAVDSVVTLLITLAEKLDIADTSPCQKGTDPSRGRRRRARGQRADQRRPAFPDGDADDRRRGQEIRHRR